jgi:hypothetical protein
MQSVPPMVATVAISIEEAAVVEAMRDTGQQAVVAMMGTVTGLNPQ